MTFDRRNEIFSKEALSIDDVKELMGVSYDTAQKLVQTVRRHHDRLGVQGKVHVQDYIEYFHLPPERYYQPIAAPRESREERDGHAV